MDDNQDFELNAEDILQEAKDALNDESFEDAFSDEYYEEPAVEAEPVYEEEESSEDVENVKPIKEKKPFKIPMWAVIVAAVVVVLVGGLFGAAAFTAKDTTILKGITVDGLDLGGKTAEQAVEELTQLGHERYDNYLLEIQLPLDNKLVLNTADVGLTFSVKDAASKAWHYGRDKGMIANMFTYLQCKLLDKNSFPEDTTITVNFTESLLRGILKESAEDVDEQLLSNGMVIKEDCIEIIKGASDLKIDEDELYNLVSEALLTAQTDPVVYDVQPETSEAFDFQALYDENYSELKEAQIAYNPSWMAAEETTEEEELDAETQAAKEAAEATEKAMAEANGADTEEEEDTGFSEFVTAAYELGKTITDWGEDEKYRIIPGSSSWSFDVAEAQKLWDAAAYGDTIQIPLTTEEPETTTEELTEMIFGDNLSKNWTMVRLWGDDYREEVRTSLSGSSSNRISNVKKACALINDTVLLPGETFSYNETLGQRTEENGWLTAAAYANGEVKQEYGGGICQVSSTLYNAALYANLEIVERECHQFAVAYLPWGMDATVSWGWPDFRFKNDKDYPIKIVAYVDEETNQCCVGIVGTDVDHIYVLMRFNNWEIYDDTGTYHDANGDPLAVATGACTWRCLYHDGDDYKTATPISEEYEVYSKYNYHSEDIEAKNVPLAGSETTEETEG